MIKTLYAYTDEMDDAAAAVHQIMEQLDLANNRCTNTLGILSCFSEFLDSGVVEAVCQALPFDVVGCTTMANAIGRESGELLLCLTVLTSEDVSFSAALSDSYIEEQDAPLADVYRRAAAGLGNSPVMMLSYLPMVRHVGGEVLVHKLDELSGGLPNFGTVASDHTPDYHTNQAIFNGKGYTHQLALVLIGGNIDPTFYVTAISEDKIQKQKAIITESRGNVLIGVNDMPLMQYMETLGLARDNGIEGATAIPFIVDYNDGTKPVARTIYLVTPEGHAVCGGEMPVGATLAVGDIDHEDVVRTTSEVLAKIAGEDNRDGALLFSCLVRYFVLGADTTAELDQVCDVVGEGLPYHFCYSGGEICPVYGEDGQLINRFHNDTFIACVF